MSSLDNLVDAVKRGVHDDALTACDAVLGDGVEPRRIIDALTESMRKVGDQFARFEIFLPGLMLSARAMMAVMDRVRGTMDADTSAGTKIGTVVLGTVRGDMHEIGKDIVKVLLKVRGFEVHDLGFDVDPLDFVRKAEEVKADIIGISSLMTTTMPGQQEVIRLLEDKGVRDRYHVTVGGAPVTRSWVEECGADSWGENAGTAVEELAGLMAAKEA